MRNYRALASTVFIAVLGSAVGRAGSEAGWSDGTLYLVAALILLPWIGLLTVLVELPTARRRAANKGP